MANLKDKVLALYASPVGKKYLTGVTGLALVGFTLVHMSGNLAYFSSDLAAYNAYTKFLHDLGPLLYALELGLLAFFVFHIVLGINIALGKRKARKANYRMYRSLGGPSKQSVASRSMIYTGLILLAFLILHLITFKFGPGIAEGYVTTLDGEQARDLKRLVTEKFQNPLYAFGYTAVMILLALHLRHGIWSAFQSLGAMTPRLSPVIYAIGGFIGVLIAVGFFVLPLYVYFTGGA
ncbi:MAG: succinate dehydrogenase cytochrome b subunit [Rhodothermales bacterium]